MLQDALAHPYLDDYHYAEDEPSAPRKADISIEKKGRLTKQELQTLMLMYATQAVAASHGGC